MDIRSPFIASGYSPILRVTSDTWEYSSASIVHLNHGLVRRIQCFKLSETRSAHFTHLLYAHRTRTSLIVQELETINPTENTLDLDFQQTNPMSKHDLKILEQEDVQFDLSNEKFQLTINQISPRQHHSIIFAILTTKSLSTSHVKPGRYVDAVFFFRS
jgi:hypothetical protein